LGTEGLSEAEQRAIADTLKKLQADVDMGARKKLVTETEEAGERTISVEGAVIPEFIPEELRDRKIIQQAMDAIYNQTIPQEGTKAWQVYQAILEEAQSKAEEYEKEVVSDTFTGKDIAQEAKEIGSDQGGLSDYSLDKIREEDYKVETITISELRKLDPDLDKYLASTKKVREFEGEAFKTSPIVSSSGEIQDGYNRIHQMLLDGEKEIEILRGIKKQEKEVGKEKKTKKPKVAKKVEKDGRPAHITKGIELSKKLSDEDVYKMAQDVVRPFLEEGIEAFASSKHGQTLGDFEGSFSTGGYLDGKKLGRKFVGIELADGRIFKYNLDKLFSETTTTPTEGDPLDYSDLPFRVNEYGRQVLDSAKLNNRTLEEMKSESRRILGNENVEILSQILTPDRQKALGKYFNRWISIRSGISKGTTFYHEAVHEALDMFLTPREKALLIKEVRRVVGDDVLKKEFNTKTTAEKYRYMKLYHGTNKEIVDGLSLDKVNTGEGNRLDQFMVYLTQSEKYAKGFAQSQFGSNNTKVYEAGVDINPSMMLRMGTESEVQFEKEEQWNQDKTRDGRWKDDSQRMIILDGLMKKWHDETGIDYRNFDDRKLRPIQEQEYRDLIDSSPSMDVLYDKLSSMLGGKKQTTEFLASLGFDGILEYRSFGWTVGLFKTEKIKDWSKIYDSQQGLFRGGMDSSNIDAMAEEWLAENIIPYINNQPTTFIGKMKKMVDVFIDRWFRTMDHIDSVQDFYKALLSGRLLERQKRLEASQVKNFNKFITSIQGAGMRTDTVYRMEVIKEVKRLTTKILKKLKGKTTVKKQFITDLTKQQDIKKVEKDIINDVLKKFPDKIDVDSFEQKVLTELLPLERATLASNRYPFVRLPNDSRGNIEEYNENIYASPIVTRAGQTHFSDTNNFLVSEGTFDGIGKPSNRYFGHTRTEEMSDLKTRRVIEVQSDLYQKGGVDREIEDVSREMSTDGQRARLRELRKLNEQYKDPTAHLRMVREEIRRASLDRMENLLFPTGDTGMLVEGLGSHANWFKGRSYYDKKFDNYTEKLEVSDLKEGSTISKGDPAQGQEDFVITEVLKDGEFEAVSFHSAELELTNDEKMYQYLIKIGYLNDLGTSRTWKYKGMHENKKILAFIKERGYKETFSLSPKVDTSNPIYKFYEGTLGKYLKNQYKAKKVTDKQDMAWWKVDIKPEHSEAVEAFRLDELVNYKTVAEKISNRKDWGSFLRIARDFDNAEEFINHFRGSATQYNEYTPILRKYGTTKESKRISDLGIDPKLSVTIYRGIDSVNRSVKSSKIKNGDFVTTDFNSANSYSGVKVVSKEVEAKDLIVEYESDFDIDDPFFVGSEFIYSKSSNKLISFTDAELTEIYNLSSEGTLEEWEKEKAYILKNGVIPDNADLKGFRISEYYNKYGTSDNNQKSAYYDYILEKIDRLSSSAIKYRVDMIESDIEVKLPELLSMANELRVNVKLQKSFRKTGKVGDFTPTGEMDSRIRILRELFAPKGEIVMDENGKETRLPETTEEIKDRVKMIEKVLAHEIGHLFDWYGGTKNMTLKRGNILGRIGNLTKYTEKEFRDLSNTEIRKELKTLTQIWNPFDEATATKKYKSYRYKAEELYAEAISVLLNNRQLLEKTAPQFYEGFIEYLKRKPEVKKELFAIYDSLKEGDYIAKRVERMKESQYEAQGKRMSFDEETEAYRKQRNWRTVTSAIRMGVQDDFAPYLMKLRKEWIAGGIELSKLEETEKLFGDLKFKGNDGVKYLEDIQRELFEPISDAGIEVEDIGVIMVLERNLGDRIDLANPEGLIYDYAKETYDHMKEQLGTAKWDVLKDRLDWFRKYNFALVEKGYKEGVYSKKFFEEIATVNKNTYTPFAVVNYIDSNYITAGIIQATGTTKGVENPLASQMLKSISLMNLTARNGAKKNVIETFQESFPSEVIKAKAIKDENGRIVAFEHNAKLERKGAVMLELLEDGKKSAYYMDKYIVGMFDIKMGGIGWDIAKIVLTPIRLVNSIFKPLVTSYKPSFALWSNPIKDYKKSARSIAALSGMFDDRNVVSRTASVGRAFRKEWLKGLKKSWEYSGGNVDSIMQKLRDLYIISDRVKYEDIDFGTEKFRFDPVKKRVVYKGGKEWLRDLSLRIPIINKTVVPMYDLYMRIGATLEVVSKVAGFQYLKEKVGEERAAFYTRKYIGTPDYMQGGKFTPIMNDLYVFSNVAIQAAKAESDLAFSPKTASGYWMKTMMQVVLPKLLMFLGAKILSVPIPDPDDPEKTIWVNPYDFLSEYYKAMYTAFPLGYDEETGKFLFFKTPNDEVGGAMGDLVWKMATYLSGEGMKIEQLGSALAGFVPYATADNPLLSISRDWLQYVQGRNPYDDFRGRTAINTSKWDEGGTTRFVEMLKWTTNSMGMTNFSTYDKEFNTTQEIVFEFPLIERMFELSSYGIQEREEWEKKKGKKAKSKDLKSLVEDFYANPTDEYMLESIDKYILMEKGEEPEGGWHDTELAEATRLRKEFKKEILQNSGNSAYKVISRNSLTNDEKEEKMEVQRKAMEDAEFNDYLTQLVRYEIVSGEFLAEYLNKRGTSDAQVYQIATQSIGILPSNSSNTLFWELRKYDLMSDEVLRQIYSERYISPKGYKKYRELDSESWEKRYGDTKTTTSDKLFN